MSNPGSMGKFYRLETAPEEGDEGEGGHEGGSDDCSASDGAVLGRPKRRK